MLSMCQAYFVYFSSLLLNYNVFNLAYAEYMP
jgi:hypothetical protein